MKKKVLVLTGVSIVLILAVVALVMGLVVGPKMERGALLEKYPDRGVARLNIDLNGVSLDEIKGGSKEDKYEGNRVTIIGEDEKRDDGLVQNTSEGGREQRKTKTQKRDLVVGERNDVWEFSDVQIKGRGNGTWSPEKKPFQIKFQNKVDLFGMGKARKWVLLANAVDASNLRTDTAFYLEKMLGMEYALDGRFVELYFNGEYEGLYYLTHAVEIGKSSVDLKDPMGILVELDNLYGWTEEYYETGNGDALVVKDVVKKDNINLAMEEFLDSYNQLENAVSEKNFNKIKKLIDVDSFAKYYLLSEFTVNPDAYWTSLFMYKDGEDDKIHAGPGWDFDLTFANRSWGNWLGEDFYSPEKTMIRRSEIMTVEMYQEIGLLEDADLDQYGLSLSLSRLIFNLMDVPEFREEVERVYADRMKRREEELLSRIEHIFNEIKDVAIENEGKWGDKGFLNEVEVMKRWVSERYKYFDETYGS